MRKLYNEFFYVPKHAKVREKVMKTHAFTTIAIVVFCLVTMSISAYAYFSCNITSDLNVIKTSSFEADVLITTIKDSNNESVTLTKSGNVQHALLEGGTYTVKLSKGESTADTGFCVITVGNTVYYTQQLGTDVKRNLTEAEMEFTLTVSPNTRIEILSHWGTSSYYGYGDESTDSKYLQHNDIIDLTPPGEEQGEQNTQPPTNEEPSTETTTPNEDSKEDTQTPSTETTPSENTEVGESGENEETSAPEQENPEASEPENTEPTDSEPSENPENPEITDETTTDETTIKANTTEANT